MQMHVDQSRHDRTTPIRGLFPKPTAAPTMPRGFHGLPLFVGETKNHDQVIFYNNCASPLICRTAGVITQSSDTAGFVSWRLCEMFCNSSFTFLISQWQGGERLQLEGISVAFNSLDISGHFALKNCGTIKHHPESDWILHVWKKKVLRLD